MLRVGEEYQAGDAVLCMPRDLFKEGGLTGTRPQVDAPRSAVRGNSPGRLSINVDDDLVHVANYPKPSQVAHSLGLLLPLPSPNNSIAQRISSEVDMDESMRAKGCDVCCNVVDKSAAPYIPKQRSFHMAASLTAKPRSLASDVIATIDFNEAGSLFATGGIARKIRICSYASLMDDIDSASRSDDFSEEEEQSELVGPHGIWKVNARRGRRKRSRLHAGDLITENHDEVARRIICTPAKLSSLKWRPLGSNVVVCGDYDGVVTEWDVEQGLCLTERYEHSGQRIWSVDYSAWFPTLCASSSGDGTVRLWTLNCEKSVGVIRSPGRNSICCAEFSAAHDGPHRVALACADSNIYVYDVRRLDSSLLCIKGHERAASYVRFFGKEELVSASIDSTVKLWSLGANPRPPSSSSHSRSANLQCTEKKGVGTYTSLEPYRLERTFAFHKNVKNFVGLSVWKEAGLIACGSESNEVLVYGRYDCQPLWRTELPSPPSMKRQRLQGKEDDQQAEDGPSFGSAGRNSGFVGAVCWRDQGDHHSLLSANSEGTLLLVKVT